jgi:hypothetical protein
MHSVLWKEAERYPCVSDFFVGDGPRVLSVFVLRERKGFQGEGLFEEIAGQDIVGQFGIVL